MAKYDYGKTPRQSDWDPWDKDSPVDNGSAYIDFFGLSYDDAFYCLNMGYRVSTEDYLYMPPVPFRFYFKVYADYLMSNRCRNEIENAKWFFTVIEEHVRTDWSYLEPIWDDVLAWMDCIASNQTFYDSIKLFWPTEYDLLKDRERILDMVEKKGLTTR